MLKFLKSNSKKIDVVEKYDGVSILVYTNTIGFHENILLNYTKQEISNKELVICINNSYIDIGTYKKFFNTNNIYPKIIKLDKNISECYDKMVNLALYAHIIIMTDSDVYKGKYTQALLNAYKADIDKKGDFYTTDNVKVYNPSTNMFYDKKGSFHDKVLIFYKDNYKTYESLIKKKVCYVDIYDYFIHVSKTTNGCKPTECCLCDSDLIKNYTLIDRNSGYNLNKDKVNKYLKFNQFSPHINFDKMNVCIIADEFNIKTLSNIFNLYKVPYNYNKEILDSYNFDLFICESAWNGNNGEWKYKLVNRADNKLEDLIQYFNNRNVKCIFWNKEDPTNFDLFFKTSQLFDNVFTTDVNCLSKYQNKNVNILSFFIDPLVVNNIGRNNDNSSGFFAGTWYNDIGPDRKTILSSLINKFINTGQDLIIIDRHFDDGVIKFQNNKITLNLFPGKYNHLIHKSLSYDDILKLHKQINFCINVNSVMNSKTMFSRRVLEALICKNSLLTGYSEGVYNDFYDCIYKEEDNIILSSNIEFIHNSIKKQIGWRKVIQNYNIYDKFNHVFKTLNIDKRLNLFDHEKISLVCSTNRINNIQNVINNYHRQAYTNKELIIIINLNMTYEIKQIIETNNLINVKITQLNSSNSLGKCLNYGIQLSSGSIIAKFDDDDYYGRNYLLDMFYSMKISNADLVGKCAHMVYSMEQSKLWIKYFYINYENYTYQVNKWNFICGATLFFKKDSIINNNITFIDASIGEDSDFIKQFQNKKLTIYASDFFNYCYIRNVSDQHTFKCDIENFIGHKSLLINEYNNKILPIEIIDV